MRTIRLDNPEKNVVLDSLSELASLDFMRNAKLVCSDGALIWSSLLLCRWSELVRQCVDVVGNCYTPESPLVIMMPDVEVATAKKIMLWSVNEAVKFSNKELEETKDIFAAFGSTAASLEENSGIDARQKSAAKTPMIVEAQDEGLDKNTNGGEPPNFCAPSPRPPKAAKRAKPSKSPPRKQSQTSKKKKKKWHCPLCHFQHDQSCQLVYHLSNVHYRKQLLRLWGQGNPEAPCRFCNQRLFLREGSNRKDHKRLAKIAVHLGSTHGQLAHVVTDEIRSILKKMRGTPFEFDRAKPEWSSCLAMIRRLHPRCKVCQHQVSDPSTLRSHLAQVHYSQQLLEFFDGSSCKLCAKEVDTSGSDGQEFTTVVHLLKTHVERFYRLLPEDLVRAVKVCLASTWHLEQAENSSRDINDDENVTANSRVRCPLCDRAFSRKAEVKHHLCCTHYKQRILNLYNIKSITQCPVCGEIRCSGQMTPFKRQLKMVAHIGKVHNGLERVLPKAVKARLRQMGVALEVKERLSSLDRDCLGGDDGTDDEDHEDSAVVSNRIKIEIGVRREL